MTARLVLAATLLAGCSAPPPGPAHIDMDNRDRLIELSIVLRAAQDGLGRPPAKAADLDKFSRGGPMAMHSVKSGGLVVVWGANFGTGNGVIAYEKDAPAQGGWVLLQDGTTQRLTAPEFAAAPKAK